MNDKVCIAADGRGEMRVRSQRQTEMAEIRWRIVGLRHRAQGRHVDHVGVVCACRGVEQLIEVRGFEVRGLSKVHLAAVLKALL